MALLEMHNIPSRHRIIGRRSRRGRGDASGYGNYSGKGQKGQRSRAGASGLKWIGIKDRLIAQTAKLRGFQSHQPKNQPVNLKQINENFKEGDEVNSEKLIEARLISRKKGPAKILGEGELTVKKLTFSGIKVSKSAREQIERMKGEVKK